MDRPSGPQQDCRPPAAARRAPIFADRPNPRPSTLDRCRRRSAPPASRHATSGRRPTSSQQAGFRPRRRRGAGASQAWLCARTCRCVSEHRSIQQRSALAGTATQLQPAVRRRASRLALGRGGDEERSEHTWGCVSEHRRSQRRHRPADGGRKKGRTPGVPSGVRHEWQSAGRRNGCAVPNGPPPPSSGTPSESWSHAARLARSGRVAGPGRNSELVAGPHS